ncbi:SRPBCC domain-containing protein [Saccharothrix sp. AJ9571]|nr:SRPBCC domain-containing protein [Saccharothrix sp. AJ9571]
MSDTAFTTGITVDKAPAEVFAAVVDVRGWWSADIDGDTDRVGGEFDYRNGDLHTCRVRVTEVVPGRKVSWLVLENHFQFTEDKTEWVGTTIDFEVEPAGERTGVRFTHHGLVPAYECYDICFSAWTHYIGTSLRELIETGTGRPNPRRSDVDAAIASAS